MQVVPLSNHTVRLFSWRLGVRFFNSQCQTTETDPSSTSRVPSFSVGNSTRPLTDITSGNPRYQLPRTDCLQPSRDLLRCHQCSTSGSQMTGRCWPLVASLPSDPAHRYKHAFTEYGSWCSVSRQATESSRAVFSRHTAAGRPARTVDGLLMLEEAKLDTHGEEEKRPPCGVRGRVPGRLGAQLRPNWPRLSWPPLRDRVRFEVWIGPQAPAEGRRGPWPARVRTTGVLVHRCSRGLRRLWEVGPISRGPAGQLRPRTCWSSPVRAEGPEGGRRLRPCASFSQARSRPVKSAGKSTSRGATSPLSSNWDPD